MLSQMRVTSTPACWSSQAVSRAPWRRGRVSSANTFRGIPRSCPRRMGPRAVPYFEVARGPALQWVSTPSPGFRRDRPCSAIFWHISSSSRRMARASSPRAETMSSTGAPAIRAARWVSRPTAQARFTAVGRELTSTFPCRSSSSKKAGPDNPCSMSCRASTYRQYPAKMPMAGAPRTRRDWMASTMSGSRVTVRYSTRLGSWLWSSRTTPRSPSPRRTLRISCSAMSVLLPGLPAAGEVLIPAGQGQQPLGLLPGERLASA